MRNDNKLEQIQNEFNISNINFMLPTFKREDEIESFFKLLKFYQEKLKLVFFIEIQNLENKEITSALSSMISFLILHEIDLSEVFLIFDFDKSGINDEILKIYTLAWIRSIPVILGGIIVHFFLLF